MKNKLPFSIIFKDINIDFHFDLHDQTIDSNKVGKIASILINEIDKEIKKNPNTSEGDLIQALALFIATRITVSSFDDRKILNFFSSTLEKAIDNINSGKKTKIGNS
tara:strand:- start:81 stop:401 length:321 start_codon:yes stop_codon:yes gene_type:complete